MDLRDKIFRDGTSQVARFPSELDVNYVSADERSVEDLLKFVLRYSRQLRFYNENNENNEEIGNDNWMLFFGKDPLRTSDDSPSGETPLVFTDAENQYFSEIVAFLNDPETFSDDPIKLATYSQPHRVLLLTFLKWIDNYIKPQFDELTEKHLDFYYSEVLQLTEKEPTPDQVNVFFELAENETEKSLERGTQLDGGTDNNGNALIFELDDDIVVNRAKVSKVNTLHARRSITSLESVHNTITSTDGAKTGDDFLNMLKWGLGLPNQGDDLPLFEDAEVDLDVLNTIYTSIDGLDDATATISFPNEYNYVLSELDFLALSDFTYVMGLNERQQDTNPGNNPSDDEWEIGYGYINQAFAKRLNVVRQGTLKTVNETDDFPAMMEFALSEEGSDKLPEFVYTGATETTTILAQLDDFLDPYAPGTDDYDHAEDYVTDDLFMTTEDFSFIMAIYNNNVALEDSRWSNVYSIVEAAQTTKEQFEPSSTQAEVLRLIPRAVFALDQIDFPVDPFATVGETASSLAAAGEDTSVYKLGFAVSSPLLLLTEGQRDIKVTFSFSTPLESEEISAFLNGLTAEYSSGADGWFAIDDNDIKLDTSTISTEAVQFHLTLTESAPDMLAPVVDTSTSTAVQAIESDYPVIRFLLKEIIQEFDDDGEPVTYDPENLYYSTLRSLELQHVDLDISVGAGELNTGIRDLAIRNQNNVLDVTQNFQPFGSSPHNGASLYLANAELSQKRLDTITFYISWVNLPESFDSVSGHYQGYRDTNSIAITVDNDDFLAELQAFDNKMFINVEEDNSRTLFTQITNDLLSPTSTLSYQMDPTAFDTIDISDTSSDDPFDWPRYFRLELNGENTDFLQNEYIVSLQQLAIGSAINAPYTPEIQSISVDYSVAGGYDFTNTEQSTAAIQVMRVNPFGWIDIENTELKQDALKNPLGYYLLPQYDDNGYLYVGVQDLEDEQDINLLLQINSGSENADISTPTVTWDYLSNDDWIEFNSDEVVADDTEGLLNPGVVSLDLPSSLDATTDHPLATATHNVMPNNLHWVTARVAENISAIPDSVAIIAQAVSASHVLQEPASEHLHDILPAGTVNALVTLDGAISSVNQPYSSFGGSGEESSTQYHTRISERLRHKDRAISMWDYERLVLDQFPEVYKAKCLNQTAVDNDPAEARVQLVVIPDLVNKTPFFPLEPKANQALRKEIAEYMETKISPFVNFEVINPIYEEIQYRITVQFQPSLNEGFFIKQLNEDVIGFLAPWAFDDNADIPFGGVIYMSSLIHFINNLSYIDFIGSIELVGHTITTEDSEGITSTEDFTLNQDVAKTNFPNSILVSADSHIIDLVTDEFAALQFEGISFWAVDVDFIVT